MERFERDRLLVGPVKVDYEYLEGRIADALLAKDSVSSA